MVLNTFQKVTYICCLLWKKNKCYRIYLKKYQDTANKINFMIKYEELITIHVKVNFNFQNNVTQIWYFSHCAILRFLYDKYLTLTRKADFLTKLYFIVQNSLLLVWISQTNFLYFFIHPQKYDLSNPSK